MTILITPVLSGDEKNITSEMQIGGAKLGHVLLISPLTFSYHLTISDTLSSLGYEVTWWDQSASTSTAYKILLRLFPIFTAFCSERSFRKKLHRINKKVITHVLVIKGAGLSRQIVFEIKETLTSASLGLYLWDGVENVKGVGSILPLFDSVATFDHVDAKRYNWSYRPLFGRNLSSRQSIAMTFRFDWCFIGTAHSDRHRVIHRLRQRYGQNMRSFVFLYFQSPLIFLLRRLLDWTLWLAPKGTLSTKPMMASEVAEVVDSSRAVLDIEHPLQRGLTMRTIETFLAEKKLITTNKHIVTSDLYHTSRVCVINRSDPEIPAKFLDEPYIGISSSLKRYYSCEGWVEELLKLQDESKRNRL